MKVVFITGGATGIGAATVKRFLAAGHAVAFFDTNVAEANNLIESSQSDAVQFYEGDVRSKTALEQALARCADTFGGIDCLFPNAGIHTSNSIRDIQDDTWQQILDVNVTGVMNTVRAGLPFMQERDGASIVLMASDQTLFAKPNNFAYGVSKGAIGQMCKSLALDLAPEGIRVNAVCPGITRTPLAEAAVKRWADKALNGNETKAWQLEAAEVPLGRVARPEDVAEVVYFLATRAVYMTGALVPVDGGLSAA